MHRYILLVLLSMILGYELNAQNEYKIDFELKHAIQRNPEMVYKVGISFHDKVDFDSLRQFFINNDIPVQQRPVHVIKTLQKVAKNAQTETISYLKKHLPANKIHSFWIVNRIIVEIEADQIYQIAALDKVAGIEREKTEFFPVRPVPSESTNNGRSPGGIEPGLIAINAPAMWALGYSGRGTLLYNYDTGVWQDHPAFSSRYIGDRFPDEQSWYGYFRDYVNGLNGNHGTHVLGTIAGLVESSSDTIGVAFEAYWIANDLVISPDTPVEAHVAAFQWSMNPDGDINTVDDIPDVINNSWGRPDDQTTNHCNSWISDMLDAIEAAGIANVFSGGNDGPDNTAVGLLQSINISPVNTFSVGSVDANQPAPYPISDFSSRGPTQCPGEGSQKIHPQVVAPGQNVRSAWGLNSYNTISGTSMAAPHVSGAVLLLKEAYPYLSGEELLRALYESATDYGPEGEDNTFGKGLIDVKAAFDLLNIEYEPVNPVNVNYDLALTLPEQYKSASLVCDEFFEGKVLIENLGQNTPDSIVIAYWFTGHADTVLNTISGMDNVFSTGHIALDSFGHYELNFQLNYNGVDTLDYDMYNNRCKMQFYRSEIKNIPFLEDFEHGISDSIWIVENPDLKIGWDTFPVAGIEGSNLAATLQFYNYSPRAGQKDGLLLSNVVLEDEAPIYMTYDYAYQPFIGSGTVQDTLRIYIMNECDRSEPILLKESAGDDLYVSDSIFINFKPKFSGHWKKDSIDLSAYKDQRISILFEGTNMKWNNLYIDNIRIGTLIASSIKNLQANHDLITLYPNPASQILTLELNDQAGYIKGTVWIVDSSGRILYTNKIDQKKNMIDLEVLEEGMYFLIYNDEKFLTSKKFIKMN